MWNKFVKSMRDETGHFDVGMGAVTVLVGAVIVALLMTLVAPMIMAVYGELTTGRAFRILAQPGVIVETPTGRSVTYTVAASDAATSSIAQADFICDGTADDVQIQAAIDALPSGGGRVMLSEGTFNLAAKIVWPDESGGRIALSGSGASTALAISTAITGIEFTAVTGFDPFKAQDALIENLTISSTNNTAHYGIHIQNRHQVTIRNSYFVGDATNQMTAIYIQGLNNGNISDNFFIRTYSGIVAAAGLQDFDDTKISGNDLSYIRYRAIVTYGSTSKVAIVGNQIEECENKALVILGSDNTVVGNTITETQKEWAVEVAGVRMVIANNIIADTGVDVPNTKPGLFLNTDYSTIAGNQIGDLYDANDQKYGIQVYSSATYNIIENNVIFGYGTAAVYDIYPDQHNTFRNNTGYIGPGDVVTIKKAIDHADLTDNADATAYMDFADTIPVGSIIQAVGLDFTEAFNSDDTVTLTVMIGYAGTLDAFSLTASPGDNAFNHTTDVFWGEGDCQNHRVTTAQTPRVTFTEDDDGTDIINSVNAQGKVTITISYIKA